jgi:hypothetical protein
MLRCLSHTPQLKDSVALAKHNDYTFPEGHAVLPAAQGRKVRRSGLW